MYLCYYDGELPETERPAAPGVLRRLGRDVLALVYGCAVVAAGIVVSDWLTR